MEPSFSRSMILSYKSLTRFWSYSSSSMLTLSSRSAFRDLRAPSSDNLAMGFLEGRSLGAVGSLASLAALRKLKRVFMSLELYFYPVSIFEILLSKLASSK